MTPRTHASLAALLCGCSAVAAQSGGVTHHFSWLEVEAETTTPVAGPSGLLEPQESALIQLTVSFEPAVATSFPLPHAPNATVAGLGYSIFMLEGRIGGALAAGAFSHLFSPPEWRTNLGAPTAGIAEIRGVYIAQYPQPGQYANPPIR
jgi:hypothetical protein